MLGIEQTFKKFECFKRKSVQLYNVLSLLAMLRKILLLVNLTVIHMDETHTLWTRALGDEIWSSDLFLRYTTVINSWIFYRIRYAVIRTIKEKKNTYCRVFSLLWNTTSSQNG